MAKSGLLRSSVIFSAMTLLSRIAGFVRDWLQAVTFGTGPAVSAFVVAYRIPNYLRRIFAEGSFSSAFVPVLSELREKGDQDAIQDFLNHIAGALLAAVIVVTGLGMLLAPWIAQLFLLFADEQSGTSVALTAQMLQITFPYLAFISMTALAGGVLNSYRHFGLPAFTPVLHNLMVIAAMLILAKWLAVPEKALAYGVLAAGIAQCLLLWPAMGRLGLRPWFRLNFRHESVRRVFKLMLPTIFSSSVSQLNLLVGTMAASALVANAQSWLYYSDRLVELPLGLFGVAIGTVILPHLSGKFAQTDGEGYSTTLDWGLRLVLLIGLPAALGLALLAEPVCATLFTYGKFAAFDAKMTAYAVMAMCLGIPAFMLSKILLPAFYARQDTRTPMRVAIATVIINVVLIGLLTSACIHFKLAAPHTAIALSTAIAGVANAALLWRALRKAGVYSPRPGWAKLLLQLLAAVTAMTLVLLVINRWLGDFTIMDTDQRLLWLPLAIVAGAAAYGLTLLICGVKPRQLLVHG